MKPLRVYLDVPVQFGIGIKRAAAALIHYRPDGIEIVHDLKSADFAIFHVIGWGFLNEAKDFIESGKPYAMMQYCWRTSENSDPSAWMPYWDAAKAIWSYYRIPEFADSPVYHNRLYFAPMGVDAERFIMLDPPKPRRFALLTSGFVAETEGVFEALEACRRAGRVQFHLGPMFERFCEYPKHVESAMNVGESALVSLYNQSERVAGLRRCEGFEMPALEGLLCGARAVCFDAVHYRDWFGDHADYVREGTYDELVDDLTQLLQTPARAVSVDERAELVSRFDWSKLVPAFWERVL